MLNRRDLLRAAGAAGLAAGLSPFLSDQLLAGDEKAKKKKILVYTRSQAFEHSVVKPGKDGKPCLVDKVFTDLAALHNWDVTCTKDGRMFVPDTIAQYDAFFFETTGDLTVEKGTDSNPPMSVEGKKAFLDAIKAGKGFVGAHCATDTFHSKGDRWKNQPTGEQDPYVVMLGGEFIAHGSQQQSTMRVIDPHFPGLSSQADFRLNEEWYSLKNFADDLHVVLVQDTAGMKDAHYQRPNFPATWARMHGKGRVFYTSMGHREDVWENAIFQKMLVGAMNWATGRVSADVTPNLAQAAPKGGEMPTPPPPKPKVEPKTPAKK